MIKIKNSKFVSLKEAARISGYASDYIGYLIRKNKISGKKIYSGVAWVTTKEAINNYKSKKIKTERKKSILVYDILPPNKKR